jgi:HAD superfamily hydrolase (TIGR01509 family)
MLKALFLDMDETLCDTSGANERAKRLMGQALVEQYGAGFDGQGFAEAYVTGIYRQWDDRQRARYLPIIRQQGESVFRLQLIRDLLAEQGVDAVSDAAAKALQDKFDRDRLEAFDFFPGIEEFLAEARKLFTLVVITNGPEFSQIPKIEAVNMAEHVDHIIIGGQEPEQKPALSIFDKALMLANCEAHEAIHVGDSLATDIAGARNSGITSVWIQHQQPLDAELGIDPHHTVLHPSEIPALIRELHQD